MIAKSFLFLGSYSPLFLLLAIRLDDMWVRVACVLLFGLGAFGMFAYLKVNETSQPLDFQLKSVRDTGSESAAYLATYLLPFLTVTSPSLRDAIAFTGFLGVAYLVNLQSSLIQVNPLLYCFGYRVWAIETVNGMRSYLIAPKNSDLSPFIPLHAAQIDQEVLFQRKKQRKKNGATSRFRRTHADTANQSAG